MKKPPKPPRPLKSGDKVCRKGSDALYFITWVSGDGKLVNLGQYNSNLEWFKYRSEELTLVE